MAKMITDKQQELLIRMCKYSLTNHKGYRLKHNNRNPMRAFRIKDTLKKVENVELTCKQAYEIISTNLDEYLIIKRLNIPRKKVDTWYGTFSNNNKKDSK